MKKIGIGLVCFLLMGCFIGCSNTEKELLNPNYSAIPFFEDEPSNMTNKQVKSAISKIPSDQFEVYPSTQNLPLSATLYKDGEVISIDIKDPRLIRLINFFNNALYYERCAYGLYYLSQDDLKDVMSEEFRLELKYEPYGEALPSPYENEPTLFDTIIVTKSNFTLINSDFPVYMDDEMICPFLAVDYEPYIGGQLWLELFGL